MKAIQIVREILAADLNCNQQEERKILDLALSMADSNGGRYMASFNHMCFSLTPNQVSFLESLINRFVESKQQKPKFGCNINGKWHQVTVTIYCPNRYSKKYLCINYDTIY
jgi:hypothetical protein